MNYELHYDVNDVKLSSLLCSKQLVYDKVMISNRRQNSDNRTSHRSSVQPAPDDATDEPGTKLRDRQDRTEVVSSAAEALLRDELLCDLAEQLTKPPEILRWHFA